MVLLFFGRFLALAALGALPWLFGPLFGLESVQIRTVVSLILFFLAAGVILLDLEWRRRPKPDRETRSGRPGQSSESPRA